MSYRVKFENKLPGGERGDKVCVIIVNWNSGELLGRCLSALDKQTCVAMKVIIVDNASTDSSLAAAKKFKNVVVVQAESNLGFAGGNNLALQVADSAWLALLNPDAFPEIDWLDNLLLATKRYPQYSCFASRMVMADNPNQLDGAGDAYHTSGLAWRIRHNMPVGKGIENTKEVFSPCAGAALYRRDAFVSAGGFDEEFFCYMEDVDLGFRLRLGGHRCLHVPNAVVHHVGSATTGGQHSDFSVYHGHRNLVWVYVKNMPWLLFWLYLPQHLLLNLISLIWFSLRGQARVIFRAKWDALMGLGHVLRKRKQVQKARRVSSWALRRVMNKLLDLPLRP